MSRTRCRAPVAGLCIVLFFAISACSDDGGSGKTVDPGIDPDASLHDSGADAGADTKGGGDAKETSDANDTPDGVAPADVLNDADTGDDADTTDNPDAIDEPDASPAPGFQLRGQLVPTGGLSMSNGFTLSGHLSPSIPEKTSSSASFSLKITPVKSQTTP